METNDTLTSSYIARLQRWCRNLYLVIKWSTIPIAIYLFSCAVTYGVNRYVNWSDKQIVVAKVWLAKQLGHEYIEFDGNNVTGSNHSAYLRNQHVDLEAAIIHHSANVGLDPIIGLAMADQESNFLTHRFRYEAVWERDYGKKYSCAGLNREECQLIFSSIGVMQISFAIWKDLCEIDTPVDLFDVDTNVKCWSKIMAECIHRRIEKNPNMDNVHLLDGCIRAFNGSGPKADVYLHKVGEKMRGLLLNDRMLLKQGIFREKVSPEMKNAKVSMKKPQKKVKILRKEDSVLVETVMKGLEEEIKYYEQ